MRKAFLVLIVICLCACSPPKPPRIDNSVRGMVPINPDMITSEQQAQFNRDKAILDAAEAAPPLEEFEDGTW